jgi:hypothetical protein
MKCQGLTGRGVGVPCISNFGAKWMRTVTFEVWPFYSLQKWASSHSVRSWVDLRVSEKEVKKRRALPSAHNRITFVQF